MSISSHDVGRTYPTTDPYLVTAEKIRELATALGDNAPAYRGDDPIAPPTFAMVLASRAWEALFDDEQLDLRLEHRSTLTSPFTGSVRFMKATR